MDKINLGVEEYRDKVYGCWLGKNIGGTLGAPHEGKKELNDLDFYRPVPEKPLPNDDLDLQLVWLKILEDKNGKEPTLTDFANYWLKYLRAYPWDEYGFNLRNLERGLKPPISGVFENYYIDNMGSPIRSEIWACIAPADPQLAAFLAYKDAVLDHAGGEGIYGEMFWAAVESAAFVISDPKTLIRIGLSMIPISSHIYRVIKEALWCYENGKAWSEARERIARYFSNPSLPDASYGWHGYMHPCYAIPNHGFTIIGWLYGKDFGDKLCKAVNCGYDTDCTGATLGSILGILEGVKSIPEKWKKPVGDGILLHKFTGPCNPPQTIKELTERTVKIAEKFIKKSESVYFAEKTSIPENILSVLFRNEKARKAIGFYDLHSSIEIVKDIEIIFHYNGEPVLYPGIEREVGITLGKEIKNASVELKVPENWKIRKIGKFGFAICSEHIAPTNRMKVAVKTGGKNYSAEFIMLGIQEAKGVAVDWRVPVCPKCNARIEACLCNLSQNK